MSWLTRLFGRVPVASLADKQTGARTGRRCLPRRSFDVASTTSTHDENLWVDATGGDINAVLTADRQTMANRGTFEGHNSGYLKGIAQTFAVAVAGKGPRLQMQTPDAEWNTRVEDEWAAWAAVCDRQRLLTLADMLVLGLKRLCTAGELLLVQTTDPAATTPVAMRLQMVHQRRLATPFELIGDPNVDQGIRVDSEGAPIEYFISRIHPGSAKRIDLMGQYTAVPAELVTHFYMHEEEGQRRGWGWLSTGLNNCGHLRAWTLAVLAAARFAANVAAYLQSNSDQLDPQDIEDMETLEIERNTLTTLPAGWGIGQIKAEQPPDTYGDFKKENVAEIARPLDMPSNLALADSSDHNYASGRLDHQSFFKFIRTLQASIAAHVLNPILAAWLTEARRVGGYLGGRAAWPAGTPQVAIVPQRSSADALSARVPLTVRYLSPNGVEEVHQAAWYWPGMEHVDPKKEADAQDTRLENGMGSYGPEYAKEGGDYERMFYQRAREIVAAMRIAKELSSDGVVVKPEQIAPRLFGASARPAVSVRNVEVPADEG